MLPRCAGCYTASMGATITPTPNPNHSTRVALLLALLLLAVAPERAGAVRLRTCAGQQYDRTQKTCCQGRLVDRFEQFDGRDHDLRACCGGIAYDPEYFICCRGHTTQRTTQNDKCCGTVGFSPSFKICCGGVVRYGDACCGGAAPFWRASQKCCPGRIMPFGDDPCP